MWPIHFSRHKRSSVQRRRISKNFWQNDFMGEHKLGKHNQIVHGLSRKEVFAYVYSISMLETDSLDKIRLCCE